MASAAHAYVSKIRAAGCTWCSLPAAKRSGWPKGPELPKSGAAIVDINMGCPAKHVTNGESGSALMRDLDHALCLIEAVVRASKCR